MALHKQNDVVNRGVSNQNTNDWAFLRFTNGIFTFFYKIINTEKNSNNELQLITYLTIYITEDY